MTIERRLARSGFTLTRDYPAAVQRVWDAFAVESEKLAWWGAGDVIERREFVHDFRVAAVTSRRENSTMGPSRGTRARTPTSSRGSGSSTPTTCGSTGLTCRRPSRHGSSSRSSAMAGQEHTRFTHTEDGVFFDQFWDGGAGRESGTARPARRAGQVPRLSAA